MAIAHWGESQDPMEAMGHLEIEMTLDRDVSNASSHRTQKKVNRDDDEDPLRGMGYGGFPHHSMTRSEL